MTDPERWTRLKEAFFSASEMTRAEQLDLLARLSREDPGLAGELARLLEAHARTGGFVEGAIGGGAAGLLDDAAAAAWIGRPIGPYVIVGLLGRGGMGTVFLGQRVDGAFEKRVAVKVVGSPIASDALVRRFAAERRTLAQFDHPNIARLLDGGATEEGFPYLVMEYVEGEPIDSYCETRALDVDARLRLFLEVCVAVQDAHRHLVVHRDLKPSNVLVTREGAVKLLDFGIAKVLDEESTSDGARTATETAVLTPAYASPEQVRGAPITTSTDVYALGILLYRLLTDEHPYRFPDASRTSAERVICSEEPKRPSGVLLLAARAQRSVAAARRARRVRGDLDNITLTALRKEPERRYGSVERLAGDVRRHLAGLPVTARGNGVGYRVGKFVRRHRVPVAAALLVVVSLIGGIATTSWEAKRARREARMARETNQFLQGLLGAADSSWYSATRGRTRMTTVAEILDQAAERAGIDFTDRPDMEASVRTTLGKTYRSLSLLPASERELRRAVELARRRVGDNDPEFAETSSWLAQTLFAEAKLDEAEPMLRHAIAILRAALPEHAARLAGAGNDLGLLLWQRGDPGEAERYFHEAIDTCRRYLGDRFPLEAAALGNLGLIQDARGDVDGALETYRQALTALDRIPGPPLFERAVAQSNIATVLRLRGEYVESEKLTREALASLEKSLGADDVSYVAPLSASLAELHRLEGKTAEAEREIERALDRLGARLPRDHPMVGWAESVRGLVLLDTGRAVEGEACLRRALDICRHSFRPNDRRTALTAAELGHCLTVEKRFADAEPLLLEGARDLERALGADHPRTHLAASWLAELYRAWGRPQPAPALRDDHTRASLPARKDQ